jgi:hypothetical protein
MDKQETLEKKAAAGVEPTAAAQSLAETEKELKVVLHTTPKSPR